MKIRTLKLSTDTFDRINTFTCEVRGFRGPVTRKCSLHRDYQVQGDGIYWIMQHAGMIASSYSDEEVAERNRLNVEKPLRDREVVRVGRQKFELEYTGHNRSGDYSTVAVLKPVRK
jgi:hypothetical protein